MYARSTILKSVEKNVRMAAVEIVLPGFDIEESITGNAEGFLVIVYDNSKNTFDEVTMILRKATSCSQEEAEMETWEVDHLGKSVVHQGSRAECEKAAGIIRTIGIRVEVVED